MWVANRHIKTTANVTYRNKENGFSHILQKHKTDNSDKRSNKFSPRPKFEYAITDPLRTTMRMATQALGFFVKSETPNFLLKKKQTGINRDDITAFRINEYKYTPKPLSEIKNPGMSMSGYPNE